jgi:PAS domain S-box-containing protein
MPLRTLNPAITEHSQSAVDYVVGLLEASTEYSIIGTDLDGVIQAWNEGARRVYGYEPEDIIGKMRTGALHAETKRKAELIDVMRQTALTDGKWEGTFDRERRDGSILPTRVVMTPRRDHDAQPVGFLVISQDITGETQTNQQLDAFQQYTRSLIESNIDALATTDPLGIITDVNEQMVSLTGMPRDKLLGSRFSAYFTDVEIAEDGIRRVLQDGKVTDYQLTARTPSGRETVVLYNASVYRDQKGRLQGVFASARDATSQITLERQLREQQSYLRGLVEAGLDGLVTIGTDGSISDVNDRFCQMTNCSRAELVGTGFAEYFVDPAIALAGVRSTFDSGSVTDYRLSLGPQRSPGSAPAGRTGTHELSFNASTYSDERGEVQGIYASARDITEQARLQDQLIRERTYNRKLIEASVDGLMAIDPLLVIRDVNDAMCRISGFTREELIGSLFPDHFTDPANAATGVRRAFDVNTLDNYQLELCTKEGDPRSVLFNASVFRGLQDDVSGIVASLRDVTDQAEFQRRIAEERTYNRGLVEASFDGLAAVDGSGVITDVNAKLCQMTGQSRENLTGALFPDFFVESDRTSEALEQAMSHGTVTDYMLTLKGGSGTEGAPVSLNATALRDDAGNTRGILASARDVTQQSELARRLAFTQLYTRSLIESNIDALMTTDPLGIITDVNEQMVALTGMPREALAGTRFATYFTDPERAEQGIRQMLQDGKVTDYELTARASDGHETVVSYNASTFFDQDNRLQGVIASARDVTTQKALERQLREQQGYLRGLIEASSDGLVTLDGDGYITDVNERFCRMAGITSDELKGTEFRSYFTDPVRALAGVDQAFRQESVTEYALTMKSRGRRLFEVSFNASIYRDEQGKVKGILASARDVTEQVLLEDQLREQQDYLRGLIEASVDGLVTVDPAGIISDVNEQFCRMTDLERNTIIGTPFSGHFTNPDVADLGVRRTFAEGIVKGYELSIRASNGRKSLVSFNASVYRGPEGSIQGIFASARDISAQDSLRSELEEQQLYNRSLIEASVDALFVISHDGVIMDLNQEATRLTGYSRRHLINRRFPELFTDEHRARQGVEQVFEESRVIGYELVLDTASGRQITVSFNAGVFDDTAGKPIGILVSARDVTSQHDLQRKLEFTQLYTRSLIESNIDAMMTTDPLGIITDVNEQMVALTGISREELVGTRFATYFTEPEKAEQGIRQVLQDGKVTDYELTARANDGHETVVSYNASTFFDQDNRLQGVFASARDVNERKLNEAGLRQAHEEADRANLAKSEFLSRMSHELRTPLNAVLGFAALLGEENDEMTPRHGEMVERIERGGRHLLNLINDVLDISRIESGHLMLSTEPVQLDEVIREALELTASLCDSRSIDVSTHVGADLYVSADRGRLRQVALNLLSNAAKYNRDGGSIEITAKRSDGRVRIAVADTGAGIDTLQLDELFTPFARLGAERSKVEGTGLGLAVSKAIVEEMNGHLTVDSTGAAGTTFVVELPAARQVRLRAGTDRNLTAVAADLIGTTARIVYIEDNPENVRLLEGILSQHSGLTLLVAEDGEAGIYLVQQSHPDLVLLDLHLPDMNGQAVLKAIKNDAATAHVPVVILTADAMGADNKEMKRLGAASFLTKPFDLAEMLGTLVQHLRPDAPRIEH